MSGTSTNDASPAARLARVIDADVARCELVEIAARLADVAAVQRFLQAREVDLCTRLAELADDSPDVDPDAVNAKATNRSANAAGRAAKRARAAKAAPEIKRQMDEGRLSGEHLDAFHAAVSGIDEHLRPTLLASEADLVAEAVARSLTVEQFRDLLRRVVGELEADDGQARLARQQRDTSLRIWTNKDTGMGHISGRFDPATFMILQQRIADQLEARFRQERPPQCPDDPVLAQDWLRAHAVADLVRGGGAGASRPEVIIVIDQQTFEHGRHSSSRVDCGPGVDVPIQTIRDIAGRARFVPVIIDSNGVVIAQGRPVATFEECCAGLLDPALLDLGRSRRHADRHQRRAIRAMYRTCAIPGCERHVSITEPHHIHHWEHGGATDLRNLLPLCRHHHDRLHAEQWSVHLGDDRALTVVRRDHARTTTGPPVEQWA